MVVRLEICTGSIPHAMKAFEAGASRIELNSSLETGGLTPSAGVVSQVREAVPVPLAVMVRPRSGLFCYSFREKRAILMDIERMVELGVDCVVTGALLPHGGPDGDFLDEVRRVSGKCELVFHRAVDLVPDILQAFEVLADSGVDRVLTSGGCRTAWEGRQVIGELNRRFGACMDILPGSGINSGNAGDIVRATGCSWLHGSFQGKAQEEGENGIVPPEPPGPSVREVGAVLKELKSLQ